MLTRHAAELKGLDAQQDQIEELGQLVAAFAEKYLKASAPNAEPLGLPNEQPSEKTSAPHPSGFRDDPLSPLQVEQQGSPNSESPFRRLMGR